MEKKDEELRALNEQLADTTSKLQHQLFVVKTLRQEAAEYQQELSVVKQQLSELKKLNYAGLEITNLELT